MDWATGQGQEGIPQVQRKAVRRGAPSLRDIMDNPKDPRHRAFGECRGQGVVTKGVQVWTGGCVWKTADGDSWIALWSSKPGDTGTEKREAPHGTGINYGTGKLASIGRTTKWTGLANGGSYFCDD